MQVKLTDSGEVQFLDGDHINRNSLNRKVLVVTPETALATRESLWVQFGDSQNFEDVNANILEPIRLTEEADGYKTIFPDEVVKKAGVWYMTLAVRMYSTDGTTFSEQLTSDKVSFTVNDSYPMGDNGYISNGTLENAWQQIEAAVQDAAGSADEAEQSAMNAEAAQTAAEAAQSAAETAQGKAEDAQAAAEEAESGAQTQAQAAASSATAAEESADAAESAKAAAQTAQNAAESAEGNAQAYAGQASSSAGDAAQSAAAAAASANRAQEIVNGIGSVYKPVGSIAFSALPATPAAAQQGYVYNITDAFTTDARFVEGAGKEYPAGTNVAVVLNGSAYMYDALSGNVDMSNYAQTNGTYPNMTVGNATQAGSATKATQDGNGNNISATYATASEVSALETQIAGKYTKPSTGIPESDLSEAVQTKLNSGGSAGSLHLHRVCLPLTPIASREEDIVIFSIYSSSPTPFTIETFFEWLISHFAAVPEGSFDYPSLPAFSCVSNYSGDSTGQSMYPAVLTYIVDDSENYGEPAYEIKIKGEELLEGIFVLSQFEEATFIDTVTEV